MIRRWMAGVALLLLVIVIGSGSFASTAAITDTVITLAPGDLTGL